MNPYTEPFNHAVKFVEILNQPVYKTSIHNKKRISECGKLASDIMHCYQQCQFENKQACHPKHNYQKEIHDVCNDKMKKMYIECNRATTDIFFLT